MPVRNFLKNLTLLFALICLPGSVFYAQEKFEPYWKFNQSSNAKDVRVLAADSSNNIYAAVWGDGIYKSTNKGMAWQKVSAGLTNTNVNCLEIDKNGKMYAGTMGGGLFVSTNNGGSWTAKNNGLTNLDIKAVGLAYGTTLYVGTYGNGVFKTADGCSNWLPINNKLYYRDINCVVVAKDSSIIAGTNGGGIYKSTTMGSSWYQVGTTMKSKIITDMVKTEYGEIYAITYGGGIYISYANGSDWQTYFHSSKNMPLYGKCVALYDDQDPIVGMYHDGLLKYDILYNGIPGETPWRLTSKKMMGINDVLITNTKDVFIAEPYNGIYKSTDKGLTFTDTAGFYTDFITPGLNPLFAHTGQIMFSSSNTGGIYKSNDKGTTWSLKALGSIKIYMFNTDESGNLYAATNSGPYKSTDLGETWTKLNWNNPIYSIAVSGTTLFIADSAVRKSTNGGANWNKKGYYVDGLKIEFIGVDQNGYLFANMVMTSNGPPPTMEAGLYRSTDNGDSWQMVLNQSIDVVMSLTFANEKIYAGTIYGIMISNNAGDTWFRRTLGIEGPMIRKILFNSAGDMILMSSGIFYMLRSTDEGVSCDTLREGAVRADIKDAAINGEGDLFFCTSILYRAIQNSDLAIPTLTSPLDDAGGIAVNPFLVWQEVANADLYEVQLSRANDFSEIVESAVTAGSQWQVFTQLEYGTCYFWRVRSRRNKSHSDWSEVRSFYTVISAPELEYPPDSSNAIDTNITFTWKKVVEADAYQIQVATDEGFSAIILDKDKLAAISQKSEKLQPDTKYYWHVKSKAFMSSSDWTETWVFTTKMKAPVLLKPMNKAITQSADVTLKWEPVPNATKYNVVISSDPDFNVIVYDSLSTTDSTFVYGNYEVGKTYFWKVKAINNRTEGYWSEVWRFTISLSQLTLIYPQNNSRNIPNNVDFEWNGPDNVDAFHLQAATDVAFKDIVYQDSTLTGLKKTVPGMDYGIYYWRVRFKMSGSYSEWTETWKFTTDPGKIVLLTPTDKTTNIPVPVELTWDSPKHAQEFIVEVASDNEFKNVVVTKNKLTDKKVTLPTLLNYEKYYWRVKFVVNTDTSAWSDTWSFTSQLGRTYIIAPDDNSDKTDLTLLFYWNSVKGATRYELQIAYDDKFEDIYRKYDNIKDTFHLVVDMDTNTNYYWRARALYAEGEGPWSVTWQFKTKPERVSVDEPYFVEVVKPFSYPNPFAQMTTLEYTVEKPSYVQIYVIDPTGAKVAELQDGQMQAEGRYQLHWNASALSQGVYYYYFIINNKEHIYKIVKIN